MAETYTQEELNEAYFIQLVYTFQAAAMQQMGKIVHPITNQVERNMEQAKHSIDMLAMLETKTRGNLTEREQKVLEKVLFELRMNYVDEMKVTEEEEKSQPEEQREKTGKQEQASTGEKSQEPEESSGEEPSKKTPSGEETSKKKSSDKKTSGREKAGSE